MKRFAYRQHGVSLVVTLFVLVVLATLGGYVARITTLQHAGTALTMQSTRAWYLAVSGVDWLVDRVDSSGCPSVPTTFNSDGFEIRISRCDSQPVTEGALSYTLYNVTVSASYGSFGDADFVSRRVNASFAGN